MSLTVTSNSEDASSQAGMEGKLVCARHESVNPFTPNDPYRGRTAPLTCNICVLYFYSRNIGTGYFKNGIYSLDIKLSPCSLCSMFSFGHFPGV